MALMFWLRLAGVIAAVALVGWLMHAAYAAVGHHFTDPLVKDYDARLSAKDLVINDLQHANASLKDSLAGYDQKLANANQKIDELEKAGKAAGEEAQKAIEEVRKNNAARQAYVAPLKKEAATPPKGDTNESLECRKADEILSDLARRRRAAGLRN